MKKLLVATGNKDKIIEIKEILKKNNVEFELVTPKELGCESEPIEDGKSFEENAVIKAKYYFDLYHIPSLADDSGISINYLNGYPGIYSARFFGGLDYKTKNEIIISMLSNAKDRGAQFVDSIAYVDENGNVSTYEGINEGVISFEQKGDKGFGYDPIFMIEEFNKTEAELGPEYKNEHSHRAKALKKWIKDVKERL